MQYTTPEDELIRLRREQCQTREDEVFGGLSSEERAAYETKENRIHELERDLPERVSQRLRQAA